MARVTVEDCLEKINKHLKEKEIKIRINKIV
jgi:hypothetical protein